MRQYASDIAFTPAVKAVQTAKGSRASYAKLERRGWRTRATPGRVERAIVFTIEAWDINCPQHIRKRFSQREIRPVIEQLQRRISELEAQLAQREAHDPRPSPA